MQMQNTVLKIFNTTTQHYGDFFSGYQWTIFGCLTFRNRVSHQHGEALVRTYIRRLGTYLDARIPYIAVPEHRYSGCGLPRILLHYHCLIACPQRATMRPSY